MKRVLVAIGLILALIAPLYLRAFYDSSENLSAARRYRASADYVNAIEYYRRAISWRAPFVGDAFRAAEELHKMSTENLSDPVLKIRALRELRSGFYGSRSFLDQIHPTVFGDSEWTILINRVERELGELTGYSNNIDRYLVIGSDYQENQLLYVLTHAAFWGWIVSIFNLIWRGYSVDGEFQRPILTAQLGLTIAFFCLWLIALRLA